MVRYLEYIPHLARPCVERGNRVYCHPRLFNGQADLLYRNRGDGGFEDVSRKAGLSLGGPTEGKGLGVLAADFDGDGLQDLYVANDTTANFLWRNKGDGTFVDVAYDWEWPSAPPAGPRRAWGSMEPTSMVTAGWRST